VIEQVYAECLFRSIVEVRTKTSNSNDVVGRRGNYDLYSWKIRLVVSRSSLLP
jgi:hypothetical protein